MPVGAGGRATAIALQAPFNEVGPPRFYQTEQGLKAKSTLNACRGV